MRSALVVLILLALAGCGARQEAEVTAETGHSFNRPCCPNDTVLAGLTPDGASHRATRGTMTVSGPWSACGYTAADAEGAGATLLCGEGIENVVVRGALPIAWDPAGGRLLMREAAADDDLRHFVLDVGAGEFEKRGSRMDWILGERADRFTAWRGDTVWFRNAMSPDAAPTAVVIPRHQDR